MLALMNASCQSHSLDLHQTHTSIWLTVSYTAVQLGALCTLPIHRKPIKLKPHPAFQPHRSGRYGRYEADGRLVDTGVSAAISDTGGDGYASEPSSSASVSIAGLEYPCGRNGDTERMPSALLLLGVVVVDLTEFSRLRRPVDGDEPAE